MAKSYKAIVFNIYLNIKVLLYFNKNRERIDKSSLLGMEESLGSWIILKFFLHLYWSEK
jgi:hypothetical protein